MKILITGATGLLGKELGLELYRKGHEIFVISRSEEKALLDLPFKARVIPWDLTKGPAADLPHFDACFHLMGETVAGRWTDQRKKRILDSRVISTKNLIHSFSKPPKVFISASAVGFYGDAGEAELTEDSPAGADFLAEVCQKWEAEVQKSHSPRVIRARMAMVLSPDGGALEQLKKVFQTGMGASLGSGKQWMSWIHVQDAVRLFMHCLEKSQMDGAVNFSAPLAVRNSEFTKVMAKTLKRFTTPAVPKFALKMVLGEMSQMVLASQKAIPQKALDTGFEFLYPELEKALQNLLEPQMKNEELLLQRQFLPLSPEKIFPFFAAAENLEKITPNDLKFQIAKMSTPSIHEGTVIDYNLKIQGVPVKWRTLIEKWNPPKEFVDQALKGPYSLWHHTHQFEALGEGTLMTDRVRYKLPLGRMGWLGGIWKVKSDLKKIFNFRRRKVAEHFSVLK